LIEISEGTGFIYMCRNEQEVDRPDKFKRVFPPAEYSHLYQKRDGRKNDGCMILYHKHK
jgi:hypothetical protein